MTDPNERTERTAPPTLPQSVAEEGSVTAANESIRDVLRAQSGRTGAEGDRTGQPADDGVTVQQESQPAPAKRASSRANADDE